MVATEFAATQGSSITLLRCNRVEGDRPASIAEQRVIPIVRRLPNISGVEGLGCPVRIAAAALPTVKAAGRRLWHPSARQTRINLRHIRHTVHEPRANIGSGGNYGHRERRQTCALRRIPESSPRVIPRIPPIYLRPRSIILQLCKDVGVSPLRARAHFKRNGS